MQLSRIKIGTALFIPALIWLGCKKELDFKISKNYQLETTLETEVRDKRNTGAFPDYWGYVFKVISTDAKIDTSFIILKYHAATNSTVSHKLAFEYTIYKDEYIGHGLRTIRYRFVACQDSDYFYLKPINTATAETNSNTDALAPKKLNRIYAEFK